MLNVWCFGKRIVVDKPTVIIDVVECWARLQTYVRHAMSDRMSKQMPRQYDVFGVM